MTETTTGPATPPMPPTTLLWRRDTSRTSPKWSYWVAGGIAALCGFGVFAAFMAEDPGSAASIGVLGVIGAGLFLLVPPLFDVGRRRNPEIHLEAGRLKWAKVEVPVHDVSSWSANIHTSNISNGQTTMRMSAGVVQFSLVDGSKAAFNFPHLGRDELEQLRVSLDRVLPVREG